MIPIALPQIPEKYYVYMYGNLKNATPVNLGALKYVVDQINLRNNNLFAPVYANHSDAPVPVDPSYVTLYNYSGDGEMYQKFSDGSYEIIGGGSGTGITYGGPVGGGNPDEVLYISPTGTLTSDGDFTRSTFGATVIQADAAGVGNSHLWILPASTELVNNDITGASGIVSVSGGAAGTQVAFLGLTNPLAGIFLDEVGFRIVNNNVSWALPLADGANGDVLSTNAAGDLVWITPSAGGISYGGSVGGGNPTEVLYIDASGNLSSDLGFTRNLTTDITEVLVDNGISASDLLMTASRAKFEVIGIASQLGILEVGNNIGPGTAYFSVFLQSQNGALAGGLNVDMIDGFSYTTISNQPIIFPASYVNGGDTGKTFILDSTTGQLAWGFPGVGTVYAANQIVFGDGFTPGGTTSSSLIWGEASKIFMAGNLAGGADNTVIQVADNFKRAFLGSDNVATTHGFFYYGSGATKLGSELGFIADFDLLISSMTNDSATKGVFYYGALSAGSSGTETGLIIDQKTGNEFVKLHQGDLTYDVYTNIDANSLVSAYYDLSGSGIYANQELSTINSMLLTDSTVFSTQVLMQSFGSAFTFSDIATGNISQVNLTNGYGIAEYVIPSVSQTGIYFDTTQGTLRFLDNAGGNAAQIQMLLGGIYGEYVDVANSISGHLSIQSPASVLDFTDSGNSIVVQTNLSTANAIMSWVDSINNLTSGFRANASGSLMTAQDNTAGVYSEVVLFPTSATMHSVSATNVESGFSTTPTVITMGNISNGNEIKWQIDDTSLTVILSGIYNSQPGSQYFLAQFSPAGTGGIVAIGDISTGQNGSYFEIDDVTQVAKINARYNNSGATVFRSQYTTAGLTGKTEIGDIDNMGNSTVLTVDDVGEAILLEASRIFMPLPIFANDAAAGVGGLVTGDHYQTDGTDVTVAGGTVGVEMIKQ